jgi:hypothetical protein
MYVYKYDLCLFLCIDTENIIVISPYFLCIYTISFYEGECGTCMVNFDGSLVKACQVSLPASSKLKKFEIGVPSAPQGGKSAKL